MKVTGKVKDAVEGKVMEEFVGFRAKMYAYKLEDNEKKAKGLKTCAVDKRSHFL
jgi:hypothetical protein